jgi:hypothetical protein
LLAVRRRFLLGLFRVGAVLAAVITALGLWIAQPVLFRPKAASPAADPTRLHQHVRRLAEDFVPRSSDDPANLARCADYIGGEFAAACAQVSTQRYHAGMQEFGNVIAHFGPSTGACLVVGAHYDACGRLSAADDNASGVAGLLELARLLGRNPPAGTRIELVAYCTEEPPFFATCGMGSYQHAKMLKRAGSPVEAMIALEMIGCFSDRPWSQRYPMRLLYAFYPHHGDYISIVGDTGQRALIRKLKVAMLSASDLPVRSASLPRVVPGIDFSDHRSYWEFGDPAVMVTDTSFYRNRAYHTRDDIWQRLDYARMAKVVDGVHAALRTWHVPASASLCE